MRPSAAIRTACSVTSAVTGSSGFCGQTLCASSITTSTGSRSARRRQSVASTASAATACSSRVDREPRSTTRQRASRRSTSLTSDPGRPRAHSCQPDTPRFSALRRSARACGESDVASSSKAATSTPAEQLVHERELLPVGHRVERQRGRSGARVELVERDDEGRLRRAGRRRLALRPRNPRRAQRQPLPAARRAGRSRSSGSRMIRRRSVSTSSRSSTRPSE